MSDFLQPIVDEVLKRIDVKVKDIDVKQIVQEKLDAEFHYRLINDINHYSSEFVAASRHAGVIENHDVVTTKQLNEALEQAKQAIGGKLIDALNQVDNKLKSIRSTEIVIKDLRPPSPKDAEPRKDIVVRGQHPMWGIVFRAVSDNVPSYIYGPTGSGKTMGTRIMAEILGIPFYRKVMSSQASESVLMGYGQGGGQYVEGIAFKPYTQGGLLLIDELDNGNANINTCLKQLNDGDECYFPIIGVHKKHENFRLVANANTIGNGATRQYVGRSPQDKALLNTFAFFEWGYDKEFERTIAFNVYKDNGGDDLKEFDSAIEDFWRLRRAADELKIDHIMSTRNLLYVVKAHARKYDVKVIARSMIFRGLDGDQAKKIIKRANELDALVTRQDIAQSAFVDVEEISGESEKGGAPF